MRNETVVRLAVVLIALGQHLAVPDEKEAGHALTVEKVVERAGLRFEPVLDLRLGWKFSTTSAAQAAFFSV